MPKYYHFTLSEEDLQAVQVAMKSTDAKTAQRATMLHQLHLGYTVPSVAEVHPSCPIVFQNPQRVD